jgi:hypothetical protein
MELNLTETSSKFVKLLLRGMAGLIVIWTMLILGVTGFTFSLVGGLTTILSWLPFVYPDLANLTVNIDGNFLTIDPVFLVLFLIFIGIVLLTLGIAFITLTVIIGKKAASWDRKIVSYLDRKIIPIENTRLAQLERLSKLYDLGFISEEEFQQEKNLLFSN